MMDPMELAERCERTEGPDRELDLVIAVALDLPHGLASGWANNENGDYWTVEECSAPYSASLDAAMSLVPVNHEWMVNWAGNSCASVEELPDGEPSLASAATPALALCAAALRAIARAQAPAPETGAVQKVSADAFGKACRIVGIAPETGEGV